MWPMSNFVHSFLVISFLGRNGNRIKMTKNHSLSKNPRCDERSHCGNNAEAEAGRAGARFLGFEAVIL